ncbi:MAG: DUF3343 domain-containing protein [Clostridia bacterium]|nr:DUF3343 domain-containing protein [Clostridia bacterium]
MRVKTKKLIVTFATTAAVMALEQACASREELGRVIPTPQAISAGCGLAWCAPIAQEAALLRLMEEHAIAYDAMTLVDMY